MYNFFPLFRACLLGAVAAWTLIVLGIAIHFQMSFVDSSAELTYVSLAVFVAAVTLALFLVVLVAPCNKKVSNILRTKWELVWLGVLAILWTSLSAYTTTPAANDSEVECWEEDDDGNIVAEDVQGYSNDVYHARYRVLQAFAFFNCILIVFLFLFILALAFWHHKRGRYVIWTTRTTSVGWFDGPTGKGSGLRLPAPVTQRKSKSNKNNDDDRYEEWDNEKMTGSGRKRGFRFDRAGVEEKFKDKFTKVRPLTLKETRKQKSESEKLLLDKPTPAATPEKSSKTTTTGKPKQYVVKVPANEAIKPPLAPIAAKMKEERAKKNEASSSSEGLKRQPSQREKADQVRQQARRDRVPDEERAPRPVAKDTTNRAQRSTSAQPGVARRDSSRTRPGNITIGVGAAAGNVRRDPSQTRPGNIPTGVRREPSQTRPDVVRSGSQSQRKPGRESGNNTSDSNATRGRTTTNTNGNRYQSNNPYRNPSGKKP